MSIDLSMIPIDLATKETDFAVKPVSFAMKSTALLPHPHHDVYANVKK